MFDLKFYLMISYFFEYEYNILYNYRQQILSRRGYHSNKNTHEDLLLMRKKIEQLDLYTSTGFLSYLTNYDNYF